MDEKCLNCDNLIKGKTNEEIEDLIFKFIILQNKIIGRKRDWTRRSQKLHESHKTIFKMNRIHILWDMVKTIITKEEVH
jgi:hypothetical protein